MQKFIINGGVPLVGEIKSAGSKNAVLALLSGSILACEKVKITNVPDILDVRHFINILRNLGANISHNTKEQEILIDPTNIHYTKLDFPEIGKMRGSNLLIGSMLGRFGQVEIMLPGGDRIGTREMDAHFDGLSQLGAHIEKNGNMIKINGKLKGENVFLYEPSVTATENLLMASSTLEDTTIIDNAACEPHVRNLGEMLNLMGARIEGLGSNRIIVNGNPILNGTSIRTIPDHIDIATLAIISSVTKGSIKILDVIPEDLNSILLIFKKLGLSTKYEYKDKEVNLIVPRAQKMEFNESDGMFSNQGIYTQPWPCFPTDLLSMTIILATQVNGTTLFFEKMYEERLNFVSEVNKMNAKIFMLDPHRVMVSGPAKLIPRKLISPDVRAGMSYMIAALIAKGESEIYEIDHIQRGYPNIDRRLKKLGAQIKKHV